MAVLWRLCIGEMGAGESFEGGGDSAIAAFEAEGLGPMWLASSFWQPRDFELDR